MTAPDAATQRQIEAAEPEASTWVAANAGSGKTRVLTDRVARLLLLGTPPEKILCLTYTKAAAAEMQNRLFRRLGAWTMLPDEELRKELAALGATPPEGSEGLRQARRLFARAIEAPGGLKIQTIHAFCAALLRRFPLEAGVSPDFAEMDDRAQSLLSEEIVDEMAEGPDAAVIEALAAWYTGDEFASLLEEIARNRAQFCPDRSLAEWQTAFWINPGETEARILADVFQGGEARLISDLCAALDLGSSTDVTAAKRLRQIDFSNPALAELAALEGVVLTKSGKSPYTAKLGALPTKKTREGPAAAFMPDFEDLMLRVEAARPRRLSLLAARKTFALHAFAGRFLSLYSSRKRAQALLDFDDLILHAGALLERSDVAQWVLFKLDGGLDHILVDEAQDTSPEQWHVIRRIAEEFSVGQSARSDTVRTLFVVGDLKQSIYSFQGADPQNFERMAGHFENRFSEVGKTLKRTGLLYSFRSAPAILRVVDAAFAAPDRNAGLGGRPEHAAFNDRMAGRVDLWPVVPIEKEEEDPAWYDPVDRLDAEHHDIRLARMIAGEIARLCQPETGGTLPLPGEDGSLRRRPLRPGDFLILVRRRSALFAELIRACKALGLPIAGADRLRLGGELAVKDLAALLSFLATPEDDLSLASALKSPLFGWNEDRLFRLAYDRGDRYLWEVLRERKEADAETLLMLNDLRREADFLRPFELLERILTRHDGRRKLLARLGPEAEDGIDALLAQAMAYERTDVPSLTGFLTRMQTDDVEVKRQLDSDGGVVRVMTVHGAKGLEAPVVILPDTRAPQGGDRGQIVRTEDGVPLWKTKAEDAPQVLADALAAQRDKQEQERMRLLYVAMTRAESWLIVAGSGDMGRKGRSWHAIVQDAMEACGAASIDTPAGAGLRFESGADWDGGELVTPRLSDRPTAVLPDWVAEGPPQHDEVPEPLSPSDLGGAKALPGEDGVFDEEAAKRRGRQLHLLFEHLPPAPPLYRMDITRRLLSGGPDAASEEDIATLHADAMRVLEEPNLAEVFVPNALTEVEIAGELPELGGRSVVGAIDRLIIRDDHVLIVDYKTNAIIPTSADATPDGVLRQMGAYAALVERLYPGRVVETAILWTAEPRLMRLPRGVTSAALARVSVS